MVFQWLYAHSVTNHGFALSQLALKSPFHSNMCAFLSQIGIIFGLLTSWDYVYQSSFSIAQIKQELIENASLLF